MTTLIDRPFYHPPPKSPALPKSQREGGVTHWEMGCWLIKSSRLCSYPAFANQEIKRVERNESGNVLL